MAGNLSRSALLLILLAGTFALPVASAASGTDDAHAWIKRAQDAMGMPRLGDRVIHAHAALATEENYQSDRYYSPFFSSMSSLESWFGGPNAVERSKGETVFPGSGPFPSETVRDARFSYVIRNNKPVLLPHSELQKRYLNAWAVMRDWSQAADVHFAGREVYRDYPRVVLARNTEDGEQRLFLDEKTGFPVKLDFEEVHYLWGQRHVEYIYSTWIERNGIQMSGSSFRVADGDVELSETLGSFELMTAADAAALLEMPPTPTDPVPYLPRFLTPDTLKVVQVSPNTYLLTDSGYNEAVTLVNGEVYVFDATQGEGRARLDAEQVAKLFPGKHKINVVVTDLAWPHVAGLRFWVANGATIISHRSARPFLEQIISRQWTRKPDELQQHRMKFNFVGVDHQQAFANGKILLVPIDGIGSEIALTGFVADDQFLWASDYIQDVQNPTAYATDVWNAVQRAHLQPKQVAAEHVPLTDWEKIASLQH
jgi:hypothetical protein